MNKRVKSGYKTSLIVIFGQKLEEWSVVGHPIAIRFEVFAGPDVSGDKTITCLPVG